MYISAQPRGIQGHFAEVIERTMFPLLLKQLNTAQKRLLPFSWQYSINVKLRMSLCLCWLNTDASALPSCANAHLGACQIPRGSESSHALTSCVFKGWTRGRKFRKREIPPHEHGWIYCNVLREEGVAEVPAGRIQSSWCLYIFGHPNTHSTLPLYSRTSPPPCMSSSSWVPWSCQWCGWVRLPKASTKAKQWRLHACTSIDNWRITPVWCFFRKKWHFFLQ